MNNLVKTQIALSLLEVGMTVEYNGHLVTVGRQDLNTSILGTSFRGDASSKTITRVQFRVPTLKGIVLR